MTYACFCNNGLQKSHWLFTWQLRGRVWHALCFFGSSMPYCGCVWTAGKETLVKQCIVLISPYCVGRGCLLLQNLCCRFPLSVPDTTGRGGNLSIEERKKKNTAPTALIQQVSLLEYFPSCVLFQRTAFGFQFFLAQTVTRKGSENKPNLLVHTKIRPTEG